MTYEEKVPTTLQDSASPPVNDARTCEPIGTSVVHPRSLSDLRSFLHSYMIRHPGGDEANVARRGRAKIIIGGWEKLQDPDSRLVPGMTRQLGVNMHRAAAELVELDSSLSWLPDWKPRVAVNAGSDR